MKYKHILKPNIKNIYIKIDKDANVILTSSPTDKKRAVEFLKKREQWIQKTLKKQKAKPKKLNLYKDGGTIYYLSDAFKLKFQEETNSHTLKFNTNKFIYIGGDIKRCEQKVLEFYKQKAKELIPKRVEHYSKKLSLYPIDIKFRKMKRRLGSCSIDNILTFNTLCMKLSLKEIDYIIVHELCHIKHKNHSPLFWGEVAKIFPNYKEIRESISI